MLLPNPSVITVILNVTSIVHKAADDVGYVAPIIFQPLDQSTPYSATRFICSHSMPSIARLMQKPPGYVCATMLVSLGGFLNGFVGP